MVPDIKTATKIAGVVLESLQEREEKFSGRAICAPALYDETESVWIFAVPEGGIPNTLGDWAIYIKASSGEVSVWFGE